LLHYLGRYHISLDEAQMASIVAWILTFVYNILLFMKVKFRGYLLYVPGRRVLQLKDLYIVLNVLTWSAHSNETKTLDCCDEYIKCSYISSQQLCSSVSSEGLTTLDTSIFTMVLAGWLFLALSLSEFAILASVEISQSHLHQRQSTSHTVHLHISPSITDNMADALKDVPFKTVQVDALVRAIPYCYPTESPAILHLARL
jgi:hypothetical protein